MKLNTSGIDLKLTFGSFGFVLLLGILAVLYPEAVKSTMGSMLDFVVINFGSGFLWYTLFATGALLYLAFSKFGNIRMGDSKPKFTKFQLFAMALSAGMGASTMYWGFIEAVYYFMDPQFGIEDKHMAMEYATAYNMFHWGAAGWFIYLIVAIPFAVVFYLKKSQSLSLSGVINSLFNDALPVWAQKLIDLLFIITTLAATALTLGLGIPMISSNLASLTGIPDNLMLGIGVILGLSVIFSLSSYIGIEKGMARLSTATVYICAAFVGIIFIIGPSALIMNNMTNGVGVMLSDYLRMSTNTDPYGSTLFPQYWTVFFLANWISYSPGVGVFITKIIQGQKLRDVILILVIGGTLGSAVIFGVCGTFTMNLVNTGVVDGVGLIEAGQPTSLVKDVFGSTPIPMVLTAIYLVTMILFTVTTLDGTSYSLASIATKKLDAEANVSPMFRLFWCMLLTALPIIFLLINADLNILKSFPVLIIVLIVPIFFIAAVKTLQYLSCNYDSIMEHQYQQDKILGIDTAVATKYNAQKTN
ncbi:BCCT family transporter [Shewanella sp. D64]|uniref:BCCT family transporter n=1 Tax=unclassified Shewanella TaxID=196818 RepID=UPI0022BA6A9C|nr:MULTISPECIES: BCCT family transporter [unclassified Shewanella]MEC4725100.1 BCCT family transporter [Shewanella sp. D64]MEC4737001.1 BCCT family transporter [Shewanella sp. E94]WBJ96589.1 BCCT family transporter [Shewanella sp. MTB7]